MKKFRNEAEIHRVRIKVRRTLDKLTHKTRVKLQSKI
jgi:hypothetical protein